MRYPETKEFTLYIEFAGVEWECEVSYNPGYEAPHCSNHDDPRFSDPGCSPEFSLLEATCYTDGGKKHELTKAELEELEEMFGDKLEEQACEYYADCYYHDDY